MLTKKEALYYDEQLHPAFAGYLFDGTITERDSLATIFHLLTKGVLEPIWEDGNMLKSIVGARRTKRAAILPFNQILIDKMFGSKDELSSKDMGIFIKNGTMKKIIEENLRSIAAFPIINKELRFTLSKRVPVNFEVNGETVDTIEEATNLKRLLYKLMFPLFLGLGILMICLSFVIDQITPNGKDFVYNSPNLSVNIQGDSNNTLFLTGGIFILTITLVMFSFIFSKKTMNYDLKDKIVPIAKKKYVELYEFIKTHPLPKHRFINEFLAFSIAFGFDDSWHKDFGLEREIKLDFTPITKGVD